MDIQALIGVNITQFLLGFVRATGVVLTAPVFQNRSIPPQAKALLCGTLAVVAAPYINSNTEIMDYYFWMAVAVLIQELLVGLIIGFMVSLTLYGVQLAGYFFDVPMGFGIVNIVDPSSGTELPLLGQMNFIIASMIFLAINGHHTVIRTFIKSYAIIKPGMFFLKKEAVGVFVQAFSAMFYFGFKIGIPIIGAIFLTDVALGIIAKLIPQVNVFVIGLPVKIIVGLCLLTVFLPVYIFLIEKSFANSGDTFKMLQLMLKQLYR